MHRVVVLEDGTLMDVQAEKISLIASGFCWETLILPPLELREFASSTNMRGSVVVIPIISIKMSPADTSNIFETPKELPVVLILPTFNSYLPPSDSNWPVSCAM